jgi:hypothetical protein
MAQVAHILFATCAIGGIHWGTGRHMDTLSDEQKFKAMRYWWYCYLAYCLAMVTSKISIGLFLLRVTIQKVHKWIIYASVAVSAFTGGIFFFVTVFQCTPIRYALSYEIHVRLLTVYQATSGTSSRRATASQPTLLSPSPSSTVPVQLFQISRLQFCPYF